MIRLLTTSLLYNLLLIFNGNYYFSDCIYTDGIAKDIRKKAAAER